MSLTIRKKVMSRNKKEIKNQKSKIRYPKPSFLRSPSELSLFSSPLSPSPPHPSIPIIRYIHTYLICTIYESSSHSSSSASKVGCRSSAGGDHTHTRADMESKHASKSIRYFDLQICTYDRDRRELRYIYLYP